MYPKLKNVLYSNILEDTGAQYFKDCYICDISMDSVAKKIEKLFLSGLKTVIDCDARVGN